MGKARKPEEKKQEFTVGTSIDKKTYQKLMTLASTLRLTKSSLLRMLIMNALMEVEATRKDLLLEKAQQE